MGKQFQQWGAVDQKTARKRRERASQQVGPLLDQSQRLRLVEQPQPQPLRPQSILATMGNNG